MHAPTALALPLVLVAALACGRHHPAPAPPAAADASAAIRTALASPRRSPESRARDGARHPAETLAFFGLREDMTVVEFSPGAGWYTEILAPVLRERGTLVVATPDPENPNPNRARYAKQFRDRAAAEPDVLGGVKLATLDTTRIDLGPPGSADLVLTFRNTHGWVNDGIVDDVYAAAFRVLRPGGVFGVVQHRARPGADPEVSAKSGYVPEDYVIAVAEAAGFRLDARSAINANPADTTEHPHGVWSLPPVLRGGDTDRQRFLAIGESDRMTLRFVKPDRARMTTR